MTKKEKTYLLLLSVLLITLFSFSSFLYAFNPWSDANIFLTIGKGILNSKKLYTDLFDHKGPLLYFIYTIAALISDTNHFGVYLLEIICLFLFLLSVLKTIRLFNEERSFLWACFIGLLVVTSHAFSFGGGSAEELCLPVFGWCNYLCLYRIEKKESFKTRDCIFIGLSIGIVFLIKFTMCGYFLGLALALTIYQAKIDKTKTGICILATLICFAAFFIGTCLILYINGNYEDFVETYFIFNLFTYNASTDLWKQLYSMARAFFFYLKNNLFLVAFSSLGLLTGFFIFRRKNVFVSFYLCLTFIAWYVVSFVGGRYIAYYILPIILYAPFALQAFEKLSRRIFYSSLIVLSALLCCQSYNVKQINRTNYVALTFAKEMRLYEQNPSLALYYAYDQGFYLANDSIPACRYFTQVNGNVQDYESDTISCIETNAIDFVISMDTELNFNNYELIDTITEEYDRHEITYRLYKRNEP